MERALTALAPAKVNLFLHVGGPDAEGYHPVCSLAVFADVGDRVSVRPSDRLTLDVTGPFAAELGGDPNDNLILRALRALGAAAGIGDPGLAVTLDKRLPVASGLGGGSSDAGAALLLARRALDLSVSDADLEAVAETIGADGPLCLWACPALAEGRGERLSPAPRLPQMHAVLVNPGVPSPTGAVYRAYDADPVGRAEVIDMPTGFDAVADLADWLAHQRNDLEAPAARLNPAIATCLDRVRADPGVRLGRLSGSGATVFGLCDSADTARATAERLGAQSPSDWIVACRLLAD